MDRNEALAALRESNSGPLVTRRPGKEPSVEYVNFGRAGVKVSPIALGLGFRGQYSADEAQRLIEHAIDSGVNLIDCANRYTLGTGSVTGGTLSEEILGRVLKTRRDEVVITTKVFSQLADAGGPGGPNDGGGSRYHIMQEVERSLRRLGTDHIDVYLLHNVDPGTPWRRQCVSSTTS